MAIQAGALAIIAADEARKMLGDSAQQFGDGAPEYVRAGQPQSVVGKVGQAIARLACRRYGSNPDSYSSDTALKYEKACRPYLDDIGEGAGPGIDQPYRGGQCSAIYTATWEQRRFVSGSGYQWVPQGPSQTLQGPVEVRAGADNGALDCGPDSNYAQWILSGVNDQNPTSLVAGCVDGGKGWRNLVLTRVDGLADDCGSVEPVVDPQPRPGPPLPPIVPIIIAPDINIDADVTVNVDGSINVDIGTGPIKIDPFRDGDGDGSGDGSGGGGAPGAPEGGPVLPGGNGGFGGDDELGPPPAGKRWVGVCMAITARPPGFGIVESSTVDKVYPEVVGNVRLICNATGLEVVNTPVQIRSDRVCLWEPVRGLNPVAIRVNLKPGFGYSYQGYAQPIDN